MKSTKTKIILGIMLFAAVTELYSNPVDIETAKIVAQNFIGRSRGTSKMVSDVVTERFEGHNSFYVVNFDEGGWVMVSADNFTVPVLAFSHDGTYRTEDEKPDGFLYLIEDYKEQMDFSRKMQSTRSNEVIEMWNQLMVDNIGNNNVSRQSITPETRTYTPGRILLNVPGRGEVAWGQSWNNDGDCTPSYNGKIDKKWWHGWFASCSDDCDKPPAGCGAVAMGQVMWYWQWPKSSSYRNYNWGLMPFELVNTSTTAQGNEIGNLLLDCGLASSMTYACNGSFTTSIGSALRDEFNYKATRAVYRSDWQSNSNVWNDLIRTEIDCERPVLMYGEKALTLDKKHYFIVDGYCDPTDPVHFGHSNHFHINFGWHGSYTGSYFYLNNITPGSYNFNSGQYAYIGISPTYPYPSIVNITDVSYTSVTGSKTEEAQQNISLPASGENLSVESGGNLTLTAGNSITLKPGFHAKAGSNFTARIDPTYVNGSMEITELYVGWYHNDLWMYVENANSYDVTVENSSGTIVYQKAGTMFGSNYVDLWDGTSAPSDTFLCRLRVRNNYGRSGNYLVSDLVIGSRSGLPEISNDSVNIDYRAFSLPVVNEDVENVFSKEADVVIIYPQENAPPINNVSENFFFTESDVVVYPNPSNGTVHIDITKLFAYYNLKIYNIAGMLVYESRSIYYPRS